MPPTFFMNPIGIGQKDRNINRPQTVATSNVWCRHARVRPSGTALYLRYATIEPPIGVSPLTGDDRSRGVGRPTLRPPAMPATFVRWEGKGSAAPLSQQRQSAGPWLLRFAPCARTTRQIPAAPSPPAVRHEAGPMAEGHRPEGDVRKEDGTWTTTIARVG